VLQMRTSTLARIDEALVRLNAGAYGSCSECSRRIPLQRLRAMPFAIVAAPAKQHAKLNRERRAGPRRSALNRSRWCRVSVPFVP